MASSRKSFTDAQGIPPPQKRGIERAGVPPPATFRMSFDSGTRRPRLGHIAQLRQETVEARPCAVTLVFDLAQVDAVLRPPIPDHGDDDLRVGRDSAIDFRA